LLIDPDPQRSRADDAGAGDTSVGDTGSVDSVALDAEPMDTAAPDVSVPDADVDAPWPDGGLDCAIELESIGMMNLPLEVDTDCGSWFATVEGLANRADIGPATDGDPYSVFTIQSAGPREAAALALDFERTAYGLSFDFDWLSYERAADIDERLTLIVDGATVTPNLSMSRSAALVGVEVHAMSNRGSGTIDVARVDRLEIWVRNTGTGDGLGIELSSFRYSVSGP